jgi:cell filamentation protein
MSRYDTSGMVEDMYEPGSQNLVLKNVQGITDKQVMDEAETRAYLSVMHRVLDRYDRDYQFGAVDLCDMHRMWLGDIYTWAGKYRTVNISKGEFTFAMARQVPSLMIDLEKGPLRQFTPCLFEDKEVLIHALSVVHAELVLIHPFREGNGRLARLLSVIMGLQAGLPPFDFSCIEGKSRNMYFAAVQAALARDYEPMKVVFNDVLDATFSRLEE